MRRSKTLCNLRSCNGGVSKKKTNVVPERLTSSLIALFVKQKFQETYSAKVMVLADDADEQRHCDLYLQTSVEKSFLSSLEKQVRDFIDKTRSSRAKAKRKDEKCVHFLVSIYGFVTVSSGPNSREDRTEVKSIMVDVIASDARPALSPHKAKPNESSLDYVYQKLIPIPPDTENNATSSYDSGIDSLSINLLQTELASMALHPEFKQAVEGLSDGWTNAAQHNLESPWFPDDWAGASKRLTEFPLEGISKVLKIAVDQVQFQMEFKMAIGFWLLTEKLDLAARSGENVDVPAEYYPIRTRKQLLVYLASHSNSFPCSPITIFDLLAPQKTE